MALNPDQFGKPYFPHRGSPEKRSQPTQGKLFSDPKPEAGARYQRGYTPERMREVQGSGLRVKSIVGPKGKAAFSGPAGVAQVHQVVARSSTPVEELKGMQIETASPKVSKDAWAHYQFQPATGRPGVVRTGKDRDRNIMGQALLHEMGHDRSLRLNNPHHRGGSPADVGQEEAFADDNMINRYRADPRDVRRGKAAPIAMQYERKGAFGRSASGTRATSAYLKARRTPLFSPVSDASADAAFQPNLNREQFGRMD